VRQVAAFKDKLALESNTTLPPAEKAEKIKAIDEKLHQLDEEIAKVKAS
jgi:uncharacterized membrane protein YukC